MGQRTLERERQNKVVKQVGKNKVTIENFRNRRKKSPMDRGNNSHIDLTFTSLNCRSITNKKASIQEISATQNVDIAFVLISGEIRQA